MQSSLGDLREEVTELRRRLAAALGAGGVGGEVDEAMREVGAQLQAAEERGTLYQLDDARGAFYELPPEQTRRALNGWEPAGPRPPREEILAAKELSSIHRVLSICTTPTTIVPSHQWALCDDSSPVRVEIQEGASQAEAWMGLTWCLSIIQMKWDALIHGENVALLSQVCRGLSFLEASRKVAAQAGSLPGSTRP
jgi:hypothetical protein